MNREENIIAETPISMSGINPALEIPPEYRTIETKSMNSMEVEEESQSELSEAVDRILMAAEARQASRSAPGEVFENTIASVPSSQPINPSLRQCHQHQGSLQRGMYCHGGDLTEAEVSQLVVLCANLTTVTEVPETNTNSRTVVTPDNTTSNSSIKQVMSGWTSVDNDNISALIPLLEKHVNSASCVDLIGESRTFLENHSVQGAIDEWLYPDDSHTFNENASDFISCGYNRLCILRRGLEAASILLSIMITPGIDKKHLSDDSIELCVALMRLHLMKNIIPALSSTGHTATSKADLDHNTPSKKRRRKTKDDNVPYQTELIRNMKKVYKPILSTVGLLSLVMERIDFLVHTIQVDDQPLLSICSSSLETLAIDASSAAQSTLTLNNSALAHIIQVAAIGLICTIFKRYPRHRTIILEDLFPLMLRLPSSKRSLRTFPIKSFFTQSTNGTISSKNEANCIQNITALLLFLVQSCVVMPQTTCVNSKEDNKLPRLTSGIIGSRNVCEYVTSNMVKRCSKKGEEGGASEFRPILANLIDDLLNVQLIPEYPAADLMLLSFCRKLSDDLLKTSSISGKKDQNDNGNVETTYISTAMDTLGTICSDIACKLSAHRDNPLTLPKATDLDDSSKTEKISSNQCICGRTTLVDTFMLDCDRCHGWFHGLCVGIRKDNLPEVWVCDECKLQIIVEEQTKSFHLRYCRRLKGPQVGNSTSIIEDTHVMRQLLLNYLSHLVESTKATNFVLARKFHLAEWIEELDKKRDHENSSSSQNLELELICSHFLEQWNLIDKIEGRNQGQNTKDAISKNSTMKWQSQSLSNEGNARLMLSLATSKSELFLAFPRILGVLVRLMGDKQVVAFRKLGVKSIFQVIQVDSSLMLQPVVRDAIACSFRDDAISVREAAVNLVGTYVLQAPTSANVFHVPLVSRLHDKGVSVRKRAVKIFRDILISYPMYPGRADACTVMLQRAADPKEDDGVRDLIQELFLFLWFDIESGLSQLSTSNNIDFTQNNEEPSLTNKNASVQDTIQNATHDKPRKIRGKKKKIAQLALEQQQIRCDTAAKQMVDVVEISRNPTYLTTLLKDLLFGFGEGDKASKAAERKRRQKIAQKHCSVIVSSLMEILLAFEENRTTNEESNSGFRLFAIISTLQVFAESSPILLLNHLDALLPYLKADNGVTKEQESLIVSAISKIISRVANIMSPSDIQRLNFITDDLVKITYNFGSSAVSAAVEALARLAGHKETGADNAHRMKLMKLAKTFYTYASKMKSKTTDFSKSTISVKNNLHRALSVLGSICRFQEFENHDLQSFSQGDDLTWLNLPNACYDLFRVYLDKLDVKTQCQAIKAMSGVFSAHPRILLAVEQTGLISKVMSKSSHPDLQLEALHCWVDILLCEERRIESGEAKRQMEAKKKISVSNKISGDQDSDSSLIGGVMTQHSSRLYEMSSDSNPKIRSGSVQLLEHLLRQGLINPMEAVPYLLAVQGDISNPDLRLLALKLVIREGDKRPDMLRQRVCEGIKRAYLFQKTVYPNIIRITALVPASSGEDQNHEECIFGPIFKESKQSRAQRNGLFRSLLNLFTGNNTVTLDDEEDSSDPNSTSKKKKSDTVCVFSYLDQLPLLCFASEILAYLPYGSSGDILFISYHIQCIISLEGNLLMEKFSKFLPKELHAKNFIDEHDAVDIMMVDPLESAAAKSEFPSQMKEVAPLLKHSIDHAKFAELCAHSSALVLLLRLKRYLVQKYSISKTRIAEFVPNQKEKIVDRGINIPDSRIKFDGIIEPSRKDNGTYDLDALIRQYAEFHKLEREEENASHEQNEDDSDHKLPSKKKRSSSLKIGNETEVVENVGVSDDESLLDQDEEDCDY